MNSHWIRYVVLAVCTIFSLFNVPLARAVNPDQVENAIERAKKYLYVMQKDGTWDPKTRQPNPNNGEKSDWTSTWTNWGGPTAIITYALLASGESSNDARLKPAIEFLKTAELKGTYSIALRSQVWSHMPMNPETRGLLKHDAELLLASMFTKGGNKGLWDYANHGPTGNNRFDHSNSQYGVLGLWAAAEAGLEIPIESWHLMDKAWRDNQHGSGAWSYMRPVEINQENSEPKMTMTTAGVATLFLTDDFTNPGYGINCKGNIVDPNIERGIAWMGDHFNDIFGPGKPTNYALYGIERVGVASGHKYIGKVNWYEFGAEYLLKQQTPDGNWGDPPDTALALLFMAHGHAPVVINKLAWEVVSTPEKPVVSNWNQRPRDAANFVRWMGKQNERLLNWQVVNLAEPVEELHDAPILYLAGGQNLNFSKDDLAKLKLFVEQGGMIFGNADCGNKDFTDSFRKIGSKLFPAYEFRELPADHILYTGEQYQRTKWKTTPSTLGLSNGARELMILMPTADIGKAWQVSDYRGKAELFQLMSNLVLYTSEQQDLLAKGATYLIPRDEKAKADKTMKIAQLEYAGNWNPEPGGWQRVGNRIHNQNKIDLTIDSVKLGGGKLDPKEYKLAHLTGTAAFKLAAGEQDELKKYLDGGGTLLIDAAGGSSAFAAAAESMLGSLLPMAKRPYTPIESSHPSMSKVKDLTLRKFAVKTLGKSKPQLPRGIEIDGRLAVIFSPLDLSVGMVGEPIDGVAGYTPDSATDIACAIVRFISSAAK